MAEEEPIYQAGTVVSLPYHRDENGQPISVSVPQDMAFSQLQQYLNANFPETVGTLALRAGTAGADPVSREEYDLLKSYNVEQLVQKDKAESKVQTAKMWDLAKAGLMDLAGGVATLGKVSGEVIPEAMADWSPKSATSKPYDPLLTAAKVVEGFAQGSKNLLDAGGIALSYLFGKIGLFDDYDKYKVLREIEKGEQSRQAGEPVLLSQQYAQQHPELAEDARSLANVLDATLLIPGGKAASSTGVGILRKVFAGSLENVGKAFELGSKIPQSLKGIGITPARIAGTGAATGALMAGGDSEGRAMAAGLGAGLALGVPITLALGSKAGTLLKYSSKILGSEEAASKVITEGLKQEISPFSRLTLNALAQVPDGAFRAARTVVDSTLDGATVGGVMGYTRAASDPYNTGYDIAEQTAASVLSGAGVGAAVGVAVGGVREFTGKAYKEAYVREIADSIASRPDGKSFVMDGIEFSVPDDKANRATVAAAEDLGIRQKMSLFGVLDSAERLGSEVVFVNDSTKLPDSLGGTGAGMGSGVATTNVGDKSIIIINSDRINHSQAIEEVIHATMSDAQASGILNQLSASAGGIGPAIDKMTPFAESYINETRANDPVRADKLKASFDIAIDPNRPINERLSAIMPIAHEYIAKGISEKLKTARPEQLMEGRGKSVISNYIDKGIQGIFTAIQSPDSGASYDVISGHFYKDGKLTLDPVLSTVAENTLTHLKNREDPLSSVLPGDVLSDGSKVVAGPKVTAVEARPRYEDVNPDGKPTTSIEKKKLHSKVFTGLSDILGSQQVDPQKAAAGVYSGNIKTGPIISNPSGLSDSELSALMQFKTPKGDLLINPEDRTAVERWNQASKDSTLINISNDVSTSKSTEGDRKYTVRTSSLVYPMGFQATRTGGVTLPYFNFNLLHDVTNYQRSFTKAIDKALSDFAIKKTEDWVPIVKRYLENYSELTPKPAANAILDIAPSGVSPESAKVIRDLIHLSGSGPRVGEKRVNEPTIQFAPPAREVVSDVIDIYGKKVGQTEIARDRNVFSHVRLDSLRDASLFQPNGTPVSIAFDKEKAMPLIRSLFSPGKNLKRERIGQSEVLTDIPSSKRIIASGNKASLYEENKPSRRFNSIEEAIDFANRDNKPSKQDLLPRNQRNQFTEAELSKLKSSLMYEDLRGSVALKELKAVQDGIRKANRSPQDIPAWVEEREFSQANERRVESEMRKRRKMRQEIRAAAEEYNKLDQPGVVDPELLYGREPKVKRERIKAAPEVVEFLATTEVPNKPKLKLTEIPSTKQPKGRVFRSLEDLQVYATKAAEKPTQQARGMAYDFISPKPSTRYTEGQKRADLAVSVTRAEFLAKLSGWQAEAKAKLAKAEAPQPKASPAVAEVAQKVESIPKSVEPEPAKSGPAEPPPTAIPNIVTAVDDARVPRDFTIKLSGRKFMVYALGAKQPSAVADTYREALMLAQKKHKLTRK